MKTTSSNRSVEKEEERVRERERERDTQPGTVSIVSRRGSQRIDRRTVRRENRGWRGLKGQPVGSRFVWTVDLNTWSRVVHMHVVYSQKKEREEGRERERERRSKKSERGEHRLEATKVER